MSTNRLFSKRKNRKSSPSIDEGDNILQFERRQFPSRASMANTSLAELRQKKMIQDIATDCVREILGLPQCELSVSCMKRKDGKPAIDQCDHHAACSKHAWAMPAS